MTPGRPAKARADQVILDRGLAESRARAHALILAGQVFSAERRIDKPGQMLNADAPLEVRAQDHPWVSRGGLKLMRGLDAFGFSPSGRVCLDIGASTGGFTDVLLARGAARVHAVDVGRGQLAWKLRGDARVVAHERTNARYLTQADIGEPIEALVCDASFIGLATLLPAPLSLCASGAWAIALIKPQFEAGRAVAAAGKGVVRDTGVHAAVCAKVQEWWAGSARLAGRRTGRESDNRPAGQPRIPDRRQKVRMTRSIAASGSPDPAGRSRPAATTLSQAP